MSTPYEKFTTDNDRQELLDTPPAPPAYNEVQPPGPASGPAYEFQPQQLGLNMPPPMFPYPPQGYAYPMPPATIVQMSQPQAPAPASAPVIVNNVLGDTVVVEKPCCGICCRRFCCILFILLLIGIIGGVVGSQRY